MIQFKNVNFSHGQTMLFSRLSFHLQKGKYLVISGPARSGKTTIVRLITGQVIPGGGEIFMNGDLFDAASLSRRRLREFRRPIGGIGGIYSLVSDRSVLENVALLCEISGMPAKQSRKVAMEACSRYRLSHLAGHLPGQISEVERRAALLARAEAAHKSLIIADSPTDGLDPESAQFINDRLAALRLAGVSILYLTSGPGPQNGPDEMILLHEGTAVS